MERGRWRGRAPTLPCSLNSPLKPISESLIGNKSFNYLGFIKWILFNEEILWRKSIMWRIIKSSCVDVGRKEVILFLCGMYSIVVTLNEVIIGGRTNYIGVLLEEIIWVWMSVGESTSNRIFIKKLWRKIYFGVGLNKTGYILNLNGEQINYFF